MITEIRVTEWLRWLRSDWRTITFVREGGRITGRDFPTEATIRRLKKACEAGLLQFSGVQSRSGLIYKFTRTGV